MFFVENDGNPSICLVKNLILSGCPTLDAATYSWQWQKQSFSSHTKTLWSVCPWLLWMVKANASFPGNCSLCQANPYGFSSLGSSLTLGMSANSPFLCPLAILHFNNLPLMISSTISLVPLAKPPLISRLRSHITIAPFLRTKLCGGIPSSSRELILQERCLKARAAAGNA